MCATVAHLLKKLATASPLKAEFVRNTVPSAPGTSGARIEIVHRVTGESVGEGYVGIVTEFLGLRATVPIGA